MDDIGDGELEEDDRFAMVVANVQVAGFDVALQRHEFDELKDMVWLVDFHE